MQVLVLMRRVERAFDKAFHDFLTCTRYEKLTVAQATYLLALNEAEGVSARVSQHQLCRYASLDRSVVSDVTRRLEAAGYIAVLRPAGRETFMRLTASGRAACKAAATAHARAGAAVLGALGSYAEQQAFLRNMRHIIVAHAATQSRRKTRRTRYHLHSTEQLPTGRVHVEAFTKGSGHAHSMVEGSA